MSEISPCTSLLFDFFSQTRTRFCWHSTRVGLLLLPSSRKIRSIATTDQNLQLEVFTGALFPTPVANSTLVLENTGAETYPNVFFCTCAAIEATAQQTLDGNSGPEGGDSPAMCRVCQRHQRVPSQALSIAGHELSALCVAIEAVSIPHHHQQQQQQLSLSLPLPMLAESNKVDKLPRVVFGTNVFSGISILDLSRNKLQLIPAFVCGMPLRELRVSGNNLQTLPRAIARLTALEKLHADDNKIDSLPEGLGKCSKLLVLDLSDNQLTSLPSCVLELTKLRRLWMRNNPGAPSVTSSTTTTTTAAAAAAVATAVAAFEDEGDAPGLNFGAEQTDQASPPPPPRSTDGDHRNQASLNSKTERSRRSSVGVGFSHDKRVVGVRALKELALQKAASYLRRHGWHAYCPCFQKRQVGADAPFTQCPDCVGDDVIAESIARIANTAGEDPNLEEAIVDAMLGSVSESSDRGFREPPGGLFTQAVLLSAEADSVGGVQGRRVFKIPARGGGGGGGGGESGGGSWASGSSSACRLSQLWWRSWVKLKASHDGEFGRLTKIGRVLEGVPRSCCGDQNDGDASQRAPGCRGSLLASATERMVSLMQARLIGEHDAASICARAAASECKCVYLTISAAFALQLLVAVRGECSECHGGLHVAPYVREEVVDLSKSCWGERLVGVWIGLQSLRIRWELCSVACWNTLAARRVARRQDIAPGGVVHQSQRQPPSEASVERSNSM